MHTQGFKLVTPPSGFSGYTIDRQEAMCIYTHTVLKVSQEYFSLVIRVLTA